MRTLFFPYQSQCARFITFAIKFNVDENWNVAIAGWTLDYVIGSTVIMLIWIAVIFAIPATIGVIWWLTREIKNPNLFSFSFY
jgi:hypothetical protein